MTEVLGKFVWSKEDDSFLSVVSSLAFMMV